jgi:hypothetical protein
MIKRVMTATINYDHPQVGMNHAFEGIFGKENIFDYDFTKLREKNKGRIEAVNDLFVEKAKTFQPDWIWMQLQMTGTITPEAIARVREEVPKCVISPWMGDCRDSVAPYLASICRATHLTLVSNVGQLPMFLAAGAQAVQYCQIAVDWAEDVMGIPEWTPPFRVPEVVLVGNYYGNMFPGTKEREGAIRALVQAGVDVGIVGGGWPAWAPVAGKCNVKQQHHVWKRAKVALNVNNFNNIDRFYSDRQLIAMASGTPVVCYEVPGILEEFISGYHCLTYKTTEDLVKHVRVLLSDKAYRDVIGQNGRSEIIRRHTWFNRIMKVIPSVEAISASLATAGR